MILREGNDIYLVSSPPVLGVVEISAVVICIFVAFVITIVVIVIIFTKRKEDNDEAVFVRYPDDSIYRKSSTGILQGRYDNIKHTVTD